MEIFRFFINIWACDKNIVREKKNYLQGLRQLEKLGQYHLVMNRNENVGFFLFIDVHCTVI